MFKKLALSMGLSFTFLFLAIHLAFSPSSSIAQSSYSLSDLELLAKQNEYEEFFSHAKEILPTQRNKKWATMVEKMGVALAREAHQKKDFNLRKLKQIEKLRTWATLKKNEFFLKQRHLYGIEYFKNCLEDTCLAQLESFWELGPKNPELGLALGATLLKHSSYVHEVPLKYISPALEDPLSEFYCQKAWVKERTLFEIKKDPKKDFYHKDCWPSLVDGVLQLFQKAPFPEKEIYFDLLKKNNSLSRVREDWYYLSYLLTSPVPSKLMNKAWNHLRKLQNDYDRRQSLLFYILKTPYFPDQVVGKSAAVAVPIIRHLSQTFPEYFLNYANSCLKFFRDEASFAQGNPTFYCRNFVNKVKGEEILPSALLEGLNQIFEQKKTPISRGL